MIGKALEWDSEQLNSPPPGAATYTAAAGKAFQTAHHAHGWYLLGVEERGLNGPSPVKVLAHPCGLTFISPGGCMGVPDQGASAWARRLLVTWTTRTCCRSM